MAATTVKSDNVTAIESATISPLHKLAGKLKVVVDKLAVATTSLDEIGDAIMFGPVPSNAKILDVQILCDDLDSNGAPTLAQDVGLYYSGIGSGQKALGKVSGDVISQTCIATAITTARAAVVVPTSIRYEAADITTSVKEAWDLGGLSSDPGGLFYVGLKNTAAAATAAAGDVVLIITYLEP